MSCSVARVWLLLVVMACLSCECIVYTRGIHTWCSLAIVVWSWRTAVLTGCGKEKRNEPLRLGGAEREEGNV